MKDILANPIVNTSFFALALAFLVAGLVCQFSKRGMTQITHEGKEHDSGMVDDANHHWALLLTVHSLIFVTLGCCGCICK